MSKRIADKPLDYDNWDEPDEPVKFGVFEKADETTLRARNILIAKRRSEQLVTQSKRGLFKSFDVFGPPQAAISSASLTPCSKSQPKNDLYLSKLAILNKDASAWISKHVAEDPYCILTPIFEDYARHLSSIKLGSSETFAEKAEAEPDAATGFFSATAKEADSPKATSLPLEASALAPTNGFSFEFQSTPSNELSGVSKPPIFSFGLTPVINSDNSTSKPPVFSFPCLKPTEDPISVRTVVAASDEDHDEEYLPPKPEVKEIKEEGSVYTVRCKLFYKKADQWTERGLGNLHIIPSTDEKFQLLVRADTNLGNILLNILVTKDIPMQIQKNNVTFACVPSPSLPGIVNTKEEKEGSSPPRPVPMLIRVKSPEAAEALLAEIDRHRGKKSN